MSSHTERDLVPYCQILVFGWIRTYLFLSNFYNEESPLFALKLCLKFTFSPKTSVWFRTDHELSKSIISWFSRFFFYRCRPMFKKTFIVNFSAGLRFKINRFYRLTIYWLVFHKSKVLELKVQKICYAKTTLEYWTIFFTLIPCIWINKDGKIRANVAKSRYVAKFGIFRPKYRLLDWYIVLGDKSDR
jgi:hypothetical protein